MFMMYRTFAEISEPAELQHKCKELCHDLAQDMMEGSIKVLGLIVSWGHVR